MASGTSLRLSRLRNADGAYCFVAADHQLAGGYVPELHDMSRWIRLVSDCPQLTAIVLNPGATRSVPPDFAKDVILQVMGSPSTTSGSIEKAQTSSVFDAVSAGSSAISLQINFEEPSVLSQMQSFCSLRQDAVRLGIPVLAMINIRDRSDFDVKRFADYVTRVAELGADLVKVNLPNSAADELPFIRAFLSQMPPVLLSGDPHSESFQDAVRLSRECGFSGFCVGRNIFKSNDPKATVIEACGTFATRH